MRRAESSETHRKFAKDNADDNQRDYQANHRPDCAATTLIEAFKKTEHVEHLSRARPQKGAFEQRVALI